MRPAGAYQDRLVREPSPVNPCGRHNSSTTPPRTRDGARTWSSGALGPPGGTAAATARSLDRAISTKKRRRVRDFSVLALSQ